MKPSIAAHRLPALLAGAVALVILTLIGSTASRGQDQTPPRAQANSASPIPKSERRNPIRQPLPFSHKLHTQFLTSCQDCHQIAADGWAMNYPPEEKCMLCHATVKAESPAIKKLAEYAAQKKAVPWVQIYQVPDYVYFSHRTHVNKAKLECAACHGPVREREVLTKEKPTTMAACINCHKEKGAATGCRTCHDQI